MAPGSRDTSMCFSASWGVPGSAGGGGRRLRRGALVRRVDGDLMERASVGWQALVSLVENVVAVEVEHIMKQSEAWRCEAL